MRHFEIRLDDLRKRLLEMSGLVESSIYRSVQALVEKDEEQVRMVLVHSGPVILPEMGEELGAYAQGKLAARGVDAELRRRYRGCLERCDFVRFVPEAARVERRTEVLDEADAILAELERAW